MARKKVKLAWISNDAARRATYKKRKKGLVKKVSELSTLCGVKACAIIYGPYDAQPEVWPSVADAQRVLLKFKSLPEMEQSKKMMNQEGFLKHRVTKLKEQVKKQERDIRELEMGALMSECLVGKKGLHEVGIDDLSDLAWLVDAKMKVVRERIESIRRSLPMPLQFPVMEVRKSEGGFEKTALEVEMEALQRQPWYMNVMNLHDHMGYVGEDLLGPFGDNNPWLDACFH